MRKVLGVVLVASLAALPGCARLVRFSGTNPGLARTLSARPAAPGLARFALDDFGQLVAPGAGAVPWKLVTTALVLAEAPRLGLAPDAAALAPVLEQFGFVVPGRVVNWDGAVDLRGEPLGHVRGTLRSRLTVLQIEARSIGCAACHAGRLHDALGRPTAQVWLGAPNTSLDLQAYAEASTSALRLALRDERRLLAAMERVHPGLPRGERWLYRHVVLPRLRGRLLASAPVAALPFDMGGPGLANGLAAVKLQIVPHGSTSATATSTPALWSRAFRSSLLWDGAYGVPGEERFRPVDRDEATPSRAARLGRVVAFFSLTSPALLKQRGPADAAVARMEATMRGVGAIEPPPFPGRVDRERAARGRAVYDRRCSGCHGVYDDHPRRPRLVEYPNRHLPQQRWRTDAVRWEGIDGEVLAWRDAHPRHAFARFVDLDRTGGYVAPILDGVWLTAPYLHNGSVPTLYDLMHPADRPVRFEVGGHHLDYARMGIALVLAPDGVWRFPPGVPSAARRAVRDTTRPGLSNAGHEEPFRSMDEDEKGAVLEFLKTL